MKTKTNTPRSTTRWRHHTCTMNGRIFTALQAVTSSTSVANKPAGSCELAGQLATPPSLPQEMNRDMACAHCPCPTAVVLPFLISFSLRIPLDCELLACDVVWRRHTSQLTSRVRACLSIADLPVHPQRHSSWQKCYSYSGLAMRLATQKCSIKLCSFRPQLQLKDTKPLPISFCRC